MFRIEIIAAARIKKDAYADLVEDYKKRIRWDLKIHQIETRNTEPKKVQEEETEKFLKLIQPQSYVIALDERGKSLKSLDFAKKIQDLKDNSNSPVLFIIGGADGLTDTVRGRANMLLSFGQQTWPHLLARIMLLEQIYRAQQILAGHPYHRE